MGLNRRHWPSRHLHALLTAAAILLCAHSASAQISASVAGNVKDATGAVLPGVTVEASSPALIEKAIAVVTDERGEYKILNLRPGVYVVTATLPGFSTYRREGLDLSAGFTATVNAELKVGGVEETVTVTGASPVVDVQNARSQQVLRSEALNELPTGSKNISALVTMTLGAVTERPGNNDVGGDKGEQAGGFVLHGGRADDGAVAWDGMSVNVFFGDGGGKQRNYYFNTVAVQEIVIDAGGNTAESQTGGGNMNMVPKEGGNTLSVFGTMNYTGSSFASDKIPDEIAARGVTPQPSVKRIWDYGVGVGGPVRQDKLWYYASSRWWGAQNYGANNYFNKSTNPFVYQPDLTRPAYANTFFRDTGVRFVWQAGAKHKFTQEERIENGCLCGQSIGRGALQSPEAALDLYFGPQILSQTSWNYTVSSKLLVQAGMSILAQDVDFVGNIRENPINYFTGVGRPVWRGPNDYAITELTTGYTWGSVNGSIQTWGADDNANNYNQRASVAYITGSHAFKVGVQTLQGNFYTFGMQPPTSMMDYQFRNGAPASLTQYAGPFEARVKVASAGIFAQDQWTLNRLTLNLGVRFDHFSGRSLAFDIPAGPFVPARSVPAIDGVPNFKDITPRLGASYDLFGNGKTAIKASFGRYLYHQAGGPTRDVSPSLAIVTAATRTWNDVNGNFAPDCDLRSTSTNGECGPITAQFGQPRAVTAYDPSAAEGWGARQYNYMTSVQLQHELRPGVGVAIGYFRTSWHNMTVIENTAVAPSDFTEYCITAPTDARLGDYSASRICGLYDINPNKFGQVNNVIKIAEGLGLGSPKEIFNGLDMGFNARLRAGAFVQGGLSVGRQTVDYCYANRAPNLLPQSFPNANYPRDAAHCSVTSSWWNGIGSQVKLQAVYPLPWGVQLSGTYKNVPGIPILSNLVLGNAQIAPALGRSLAACPATGTCTATVSIPLVPIGNNVNTPVAAKLFDMRLNQTDLRVSKSVRIGGTRLEGIFDIYNVFNTRPPQGVAETYGAAWLRPTSLLGGRLLKFGAQVEF